MTPLGIHQSKSEVIWNVVSVEGRKKMRGPETGWLILRVKALRSVETSVAIYQPTKCNITEDLNLLELCHPWKNESNIMGLQNNLVVSFIHSPLLHSCRTTFTCHVTIGTSMLDPQPSWPIVHRPCSAVFHFRAWGPVVLFSRSAGPCSHSLKLYI